MTYQNQKKTSDGDNNDEGMDELLKLASDIDLEEEIMAHAGDEGDSTDDNNMEGWIDEHEEMSEDELIELEESTQPVRLLLTKVR